MGTTEVVQVPAQLVTGHFGSWSGTSGRPFISRALVADLVPLQAYEGTGRCYSLEQIDQEGYGMAVRYGSCHPGKRR